MSTSKGTDETAASLLADVSKSFDPAPWAVTELRGNAHIVRYANPAFCRLINRASERVIGEPFDTLLPPTEKWVSRLNRVFRTGVAESFIAEEQAAPGPLLFSCNLWPVFADGRTAGIMIQVHETGPLHETRQAISQALLLGALRQDQLIEAANLSTIQLKSEISGHKQRERDAQLLANEVAHRVKNNLQVITSLINIEIRRSSESCAHGYAVMRDRIMAIAHLYDLISHSSRNRTVNLQAYLTEIANTLSASLLEGTSNIRIVVEAEALTIDAERAVPFGLLVNELATNAIKYAFPTGNGLITLSINRQGHQIELRVADNGIGMNFKGHSSSSATHGSDYVAIFVRQLGGTLLRSAQADAGTTISIRFPVSSEPEVEGR